MLSLTPTSPRLPLLYRSPRFFRFALTWFPPFWGTGIRVVDIAGDFSRIEVEMRTTLLNRNAFGTHFGGSLYSMCDPFLGLMLVVQLGTAYTVWDKAAQIDFVKPGRGTVRAVFTWSKTEIDAIRAQAANGKKVLPEREVLVTDDNGDTVARVHKTMYVRLKKKD